MALLIRTTAELRRLRAMTKLLMRWTVMYESMGALEEAFSALELARVIMLELCKPSRRWVWQLPHVPLPAARLHTLVRIVVCLALLVAHMRRRA